MNKYKKDFPIFKRKIFGKPLTYLDNAATSQIPIQVLKAIEDFETNHRANVHRGIHLLSEEASNMYESARKTVARFIHAVVPEEIVFTRNTTEAVNLVTYTWGEQYIKRGDIILVSEIEHHSNLVPWQLLVKRKKAKLVYIPIDSNYELNFKAVKVDWSKVKLVSMVHVSNVLGTVNDVRQHIKYIRKKYKNKEDMPKILVDAAQSVPHMPVNVQKLGADFVVFSGHKMCGPMGIGVLWGKREILEKMPPFLTGGGMIREVSLQDANYAPFPEKFEAGTPNVTGAIGLAVACDYLESIGMKNIQKREQELTKYALKKFLARDDIEIYGPTNPKKKVGVIAFNLKDTPSHDLATILDTEGIAVRSGHHCVMPWHTKNDLAATTRMSFYLYNEKSDVDKVLKGIEKAKKLFTFD